MEAHSHCRSSALSSYKDHAKLEREKIYTSTLFSAPCQRAALRCLAMFKEECQARDGGEARAWPTCVSQTCRESISFQFYIASGREVCMRESGAAINTAGAR